MYASPKARIVWARARVVYIQPGKGMGLMFTAVEPEQLGTLNTWIAESREISWLAANRRRSQRVLMKIPVRVSGQAGAALFFEEDTHTLAISAHGALMLVAAPVYRGQRFTLSNVQTNAALECVVVHVDKVAGRPNSGGSRVHAAESNVLARGFSAERLDPAPPRREIRLKLANGAETPSE